jgi:hypothetical protein
LINVLTIHGVQVLPAVLFLHNTGLREGGSAGISAREPENQEGACESLKGPIALAIDVGLQGGTKQA